ncbi:MAG: transglutaminase family protein [Novosphingobium sp.]|uniref:transglutaminase-like domain-containing protein n=1 Tax=Novosphingobium sp. TaxID=1874826 RepID=UPI0032BD667A
MSISVYCELAYSFSRPTDVLMQIEAAQLPEQRVLHSGLGLSPVAHFSRVAGHDDVGERIWLRVERDLVVDYTAEIEISRAPEPEAFSTLSETPPHLLPGDVVDYLMPSRFCQSDLFERFVEGEFAGLSGGARIMAIRDWIAGAFTYGPSATIGHASAVDSLLARRGVCRDFAHVLITLARAASIPARYVSVYAPDVAPPDFHAVAEVYLGGSWHLLDATGMAGPTEIAKIGVGRDAADVAFLSTFGDTRLVNLKVHVSRS